MSDGTWQTSWTHHIALWHHRHSLSLSTCATSKGGQGIFDTFQARCKLKMCCFGLPLLPYVGIFDDICLTRRVSRLSAWTHHVCFARFNYLGFVGVSARSCRIAFLRCGWVWKKLVRRDLIDLMFSSLLFCLPVDRHAFILVKKHTCQNRLGEQQAPHVFHLVALLAFLAAVILARWTFWPVSWLDFPYNSTAFNKGTCTGCTLVCSMFWRKTWQSQWYLAARTVQQFV